MIKVEVKGLEIIGLEGVLNKVGKLISAIDQVEILDEAEAILLNRTRGRFLAEVDPDGVAWRPSYAGMRRRARGGTGTLFDTGRLFHSIQAYRVGANERDIGTDVPYGRKHQLGIGVVQRRFLGISQEDLSIITARVVQRVTGSLS